jgi:CCR4-NOT transcription complex subunit 7/8
MTSPRPEYLMKACKTLKGGLQELADDLNVPRIGPQHQAGSDSLLTASAFFALRSKFFEDQIDDDKYKCAVAPDCLSPTAETRAGASSSAWVPRCRTTCTVTPPRRPLASAAPSPSLRCPPRPRPPSPSGIPWPTAMSRIRLTRIAGTSTGERVADGGRGRGWL